MTRGVKGVVTVLDGRTGRPRTRVNIEGAAKLRVTEEDRDGLRFRKYIEHPDSAAPAGKKRIACARVPAEDFDPSCTAIDLSFPQKNSYEGEADHGRSRIEAAR